MVSQDFKTDELKRALEDGFGWRLGQLDRLPGYAYSINFKAVRETDGLHFLVKLTPDCSDSDCRARFDNLTQHLKDLSGTLAVQELFPDGPRTFGPFRLRFLTWCAGERVFPDRLTRSQLSTFLDDYQEFSAGMQRTGPAFPPRDALAWKRKIVEKLGGWGQRSLARLISREMPDEDVAHRCDRLRVIHGDFHHGNFLFVGGKVTGFFDLEEFRMGYPSEDIVRYFVCAAEHLRFYEMHRIGRLLGAFESAVRHLPYSAHEWKVAINGLFLRKIEKRVRRGCGLVQAVNLLWRARFYRQMRQLAETARETSA